MSPRKSSENESPPLAATTSASPAGPAEAPDPDFAKADKDAQKSRHPSGHTVAELQTELARTRDELAKEREELAKERATRAALEQAVRALAAQKPQCPACAAPIPVSGPYAEAKLRK